MQNLIKSCFIFSLLIVLPSFVGCPGDTGPKVYHVSGKVTLDGAPLDAASVTFHPETPSDTVLPASGRSDKDGNYTIQTTTGTPNGGTTPGKFKVIISKTKELWDGKSYRPNPGGEPIKDSRAINALPEKYTKIGTTPFTAEVTTDKAKNVFNFDMVSK